MNWIELLSDKMSDHVWNSHLNLDSQQRTKSLFKPQTDRDKIYDCMGNDGMVPNKMCACKFDCFGTIDPHQSGWSLYHQERLSHDTYICVALGPIGPKSPNQMAKFKRPRVLTLSQSCTLFAKFLGEI